MKQDVEKTIVFKHHHHDGDSSSSDSFDNSQSGESPSSSNFQSGNILLTDPTSLNPFQFYEFTTDGESVYNYTTFLRSNESERCVPNDMGFLNSNTLLLLDSKQGIFEASNKGEVIGYWNDLKTNTINKLGCSLSKMNVDTVNNRVYVASLNINCDYTYEIGIFVYNFNGELEFKILNSNFNTTNGIAGDSNGNIWVTDINEIFIFDNTGKFFKTVSPINASDKIAYNGIIIDSNDNIYISVPSYQGDMIIQINTKGELIRSIKLIGLFTGNVSGLPGSLALSNKHIYVEVPYASKKEAPPSSSDSASTGGNTSGSGSSSEWLLFDQDENEDEEEESFSLLEKNHHLGGSSASGSTSSKKQKPDIIQSYNLEDGSFNKAWGGHSCNPKNILCIPFSGFLIIQ